MKQMRIITLQGNWNYGNRLQNYATAKIYESYGFQVTSLIRSKALDPIDCIKQGIKHLMAVGGNPEDRMSRERAEAFERFNSLLSFEVVTSMSHFSDLDSWYSVGSDQVWSTAYKPKLDEWYFLKMTPMDRRIALAPSIGLDRLNEEQMRRLSKGVSGFNKVSVRERRGAEIIQQAAGIKADIICDPTLVLSREEWLSIADDRITPCQDYVFTYILGGDSASLRDVLSAVTKFGTIPCVNLSDRARAGEPDAGPAEYISLIANARHVVTDSFHAAVFASIMHIPLTIVRREGGHGMFSRLESLASMLRIEDKIYSGIDHEFSASADYSGVDDKIDIERRGFLSYLEACLES